MKITIANDEECAQIKDGYPTGDDTSLFDMSVGELLTLANNGTIPLARRAGAAQVATLKLERELERRCELIFPDFYWLSAIADGAFCLEDELRFSFPQARKYCADNHLTKERDKALRELGFEFLNDVRLGLC